MDLDYEQACKQALDPKLREGYWKQYCSMVDWIKEPTQILQQEDEYTYKWFKDGSLNMSYNCVDRHAEKTPDAKAIIYESPLTGKSRYYNNL